MAIGDKPNQNLFGTNYNPEDEEEKKARLAAQGAMMGAPPIEGQNNELPAYGEILDSRALPFSNKTKFPINEMMGAGGFPALDSNIVAQVPGIQNIRNPGAFNPANMEPARPIMSAGTVERVTPNYLAVNKISDVVQGLRDAVGTESVSMDEYRVAQATQTPSVESALGATPSATLPVETPSVGAQEQGQAIPQGSLMGSYQAPDGQSIGMFQGQPNAPITQEQLNSLSGQIVESSSPFISGGLTDASGQTIAGPAGRPEGMSPFMDQSGQVAYADPETANRMNALAGQEAQENRAAQQRFLASDAAKEMSNRQLDSVINSTYSQESKAREARLDARPDFGEAVSDRDRRAARGDDISMADQTSMAKANARDATPTEVARGNQVANALGVDLETGQPLQATGGLTFEQQLAQNKFEFDVNKFNFEQAMNASDEATANAQSATAAKFAVRDQLRQGANVMDKAQRAGKNIGFSTTGATGALLGLVPGTGAYDQKATVETLEADAAFSALQRMRDASKTGGALGNVSERELDLLKATAGSLRVGQSEEQFRENLAQYVERYNEAMLNIYDAFVADYGEKDANEAFKVNDRQDLIPQQGDNQSTGGGTTTETASGRYSVTVL